jgi:hypothetical protein
MMINLFTSWRCYKLWSATSPCTTLKGHTPFCEQAHEEENTKFQTELTKLRTELVRLKTENVELLKVRGHVLSNVPCLPLIEHVCQCAPIHFSRFA